MAERIGGDDSSPRHFGIFLLGVALGSLVRVGAFLFPTQVVRYLEEALLPDAKKAAPPNEK